MNQPLLIFEWLKSHADSKLELCYDPELKIHTVSVFVGKDRMIYGASINIQPFEAVGMTERRLLNEIDNLHWEALKKQNEQMEG